MGKSLFTEKIGNNRGGGCVWMRQEQHFSPARLIPSLPKAGNSLGHSKGAPTSCWIHRELKAGRNGSCPDTVGFESRNFQLSLSAPMSWELLTARATPGISPRNLEAAKGALPSENKSHSQYSGLFPFILLPPDQRFDSGVRLC